MFHVIRLPVAAMLCVAAGAHAQSPTPTRPATGNGSARLAAPAQSSLNLPRLKARGNPHDANVVAKAQATIDDLPTLGKPNVREATSQNLRYLTIDAGTSWSRALRGGPKDTVFVSFLAYGSEGTVIDAAGARLQIKAASRPGYAQLQIGKPSQRGVTWIPFGGPIKIETHGGNPLATLPVLTVRIDRSARVWDLYLANRLALADQPLASLPPGAPNQFTLRAGAAGALVSGLTSADENPLYEDENANGIDDAFEQQNRGALLAAKAPAAERSALARQWQQDQQRRQLKPWPVQRPLPDGAPGSPRPKG